MGSVISNNLLANGLYIDATDRGRRRKKSSKQAQTTARRAPTDDTQQWKKNAIGVSLAAIVVTLVVCVFFFAQWFVAPTTFPVKRVAIQGELTYLANSDIEKVIQPYLTQSFFSIDVVEIYQAVIALPWVKSAEVKRVWPDSIAVDITEHAPYALWQDDKILTESGRLITPENVVVNGLPVLAGEDHQIGDVITMFSVIQKKLGRVDLQLDHLSVDERGVWFAQLVNGIQLKLGREDVVSHVDRLVSVFDVAIKSQLDQIAAIDLRYTNGLSIKWRNDQQVKANNG